MDIQLSVKNHVVAAQMQTGNTVFSNIIEKFWDAETDSKYPIVLEYDGNTKVSVFPDRRSKQYRIVEVRKKNSDGEYPEAPDEVYDHSANSLWQVVGGLYSGNEDVELQINKISKALDVVYEMYKTSWMRKQPDSLILDEYQTYFGLMGEYEDYENYSFKDHLDEHGFSGSLYVCYGEFLGAELMDDKYVRSLVGRDSELYASIQDYWRLNSYY